MAFYLVAFYLVALYLVALYLVALPGGSTWCINVLYLAPLCTTNYPPYQPSQNKMGQSFEIVVMIKKIAQIPCKSMVYDTLNNYYHKF